MDKADVVTKGTGDIKRARIEDQRSLEDLKRSVADFANQTINGQMDAEDARIEYLKASGAKQETIFAAEMDLAVRRENFQHQQRENEIQMAAQQLRDADIKGTELVRINAQMNAQLEAEGIRHNQAMAVITASQGQKSILGQWRQLAAQLPGYKQQPKDFAVSMPESIGGAFAQITTSWDGTWKGFLTSLKESFFQTIQQMLAELFRVQLIKGIIGIIGAISGAASSSGGNSVNSTGNSWGGTWYGGPRTFAEGGVPPMGQMSLVGERGPELFVPSVAGRVLSH